MKFIMYEDVFSFSFEFFKHITLVLGNGHALSSEVVAGILLLVHRC